MQIISFAWTIDALLAGKKTVTRRDWPDDYARQFRPGDLAQAYDKSPRAGGKRRATVRLRELRREPLSRLLTEPEYGWAELIKEGGLWASVDQFIAQSGAPKHGPLYRIEFSLEEIEGRQMALPIIDPVPAIHAEFCALTNQQIKLSMVRGLWQELIYTHGCTAEDVAATARYLMREVKAGRRQIGCLKVHNFSNPVLFAGDLALARKVRSKQRPAPAVPQDQAPAAPADGALGRQTAAHLAAFRAALRGGNLPS